MLSGCTAILLCAGEGTRIRDVTRGPKCLLPVAGKPIIQHQLDSLQLVGVEDVVIVTGHQADFLQQSVNDFRPEQAVRFIEKLDFQTMGNSHSLLTGLKAAAGPVIIFDGDLMFAPELLAEFLQDPRSAFLVGRGRIDDWECAKALADADGYLRKLVDKRLLTAAELRQYQFAGEALGIIYLDDAHRASLITAAERFLCEPANHLKNWEHLFSEFLPNHAVAAQLTTSTRWIEIDTAEDYRAAQALFAPDGA